MQVFFYFLYNFYILYAKFSIFICIFIIYYLIFFSFSTVYSLYYHLFFSFFLHFSKTSLTLSRIYFFTARKTPASFVTSKPYFVFFFTKDTKSLYLSTINLFWFPWHERTYEIRDSGFVTSR